MATRLNKTLTREIDLALDNTQPVPVMVTLFPDGTMQFRPKGKARRYQLPLAHAYSQAVKASVVDERRVSRPRKANRGLLSMGGRHA